MSDELRARWNSDAGHACRQRILSQLGTRRPTLDEPGLGFPTEGWSSDVPDLRGFDFAGWSFDGVYFGPARLEGASFDGATMTSVQLTGATLRGASFRGARLRVCDLDECDATNAVFDGATVGARMDGAVLENASFRNAVLFRTHFGAVTRANAVFDGCVATSVGVGYSQVGIGFLRWQHRAALREALTNAGSWIVFFTQPEAEGAKWIGVSGVRPCPPSFRAVAARQGPSAGLLAADPDDPRLRAALGPFEYEAYVADLARAGVRVGSPEDAFVLRDSSGRRFHPVYDLLSVVRPTREPARFGDQPTHCEPTQNLWGLPHARTWLQRLNFALGHDLVPRSPRNLLRPEDALRPRMLPGGLFPVVAYADDGARLSIHTTGEEVIDAWGFVKQPIDVLLGPQLDARGGGR